MSKIIVRKIEDKDTWKEIIVDDIATNTDLQSWLDNKADKITGWTENNFVAIDNQWNIKDSWKKASDFAETNHTHTSWDITDFDSAVSNNSDVQENTNNRHNHSNKTVLDNIIDSGSWDEFLSDDWNYKKVVTSVNWKDWEVLLTKEDVWLWNVDNTSDLDKPISTATQNALDLKADITYVDDTFSNVRWYKNFIINWKFDIWQRWTSFHWSWYFADRFKLFANAPVDITKIETQIGDIKTNAVRFEVTENYTSRIDQYQMIEDYKALSWQTITLSARVRTNVDGFKFRHGSTTFIWDNLPADWQWHYVWVVYQVPELVWVGIGPNETWFWIVKWPGIEVNSGDYFEYTMFQIELWDKPTAFELKPYALELSLCQRYYQKLDRWQRTNGPWPIPIQRNSNWTVFLNYVYPVEMRVPPSFHTNLNSDNYWDWGEAGKKWYVRDWYVRTVEKTDTWFQVKLDSNECTTKTSSIKILELSSDVWCNIMWIRDDGYIAFDAEIHS